MQQRAAFAPAPPNDAEARLSAYFADYADTDEHRFAAWLARHPRRALQAVRDLRLLPLEHVELGHSTEGCLVSAALPGTAKGPRSIAAALTLPDDAAAFTEGSSKQTLRRKARAAEKAGVTWSRVDDPDERRLLIDLANEVERTHPMEQYRKTPPDQHDLVRTRLWLVARGADGRPLVLSITPVDGREALLGLFRVFEMSPEASAARYLMTQVLAEQLIAQGVRHLFDGVHPANLTNGLRHFQRMVGFRLVRVAKTRVAHAQEHAAA